MAVETRTWRRTAALGLLPVRAGGRGVAGRVRVLRGGDRDAVRRAQRAANADDLRRTLGGLKGGALKAGQLLSTVDSLFPPDPEGSWQQALTALQESNGGVAFDDVLPVLRAELGPDWQRLVELDPRPSAAASLGQVHRGRWHDGRDVAVKLQYPGVGEAVAADLRALGVSLRLTSVVARGLVVPPVLGELRTRLAEELDYRQEARHQAAFADAYRDDPDVVVPRVVHATRRVLVTEWLSGSPLVSAAGAEDEVRGRLALRYQSFLLGAPARCGLLHADPHPGNFRRCPDDRLGVLDFGAVVAMPGGLPPAFGRLVHAFAAAAGSELSDRGEAALAATLCDAGLVRPGRRVDVRSLAAIMAPFSEPAGQEVFAYSPEWLRSCFARNEGARDPDYTVGLGLNLPAEHLMTQRVWLGCVGTLCRLRATVPVRPVLADLLPGFAEAAARPG